MRIGNSAITRLYAGTADVNRVYLGTQLVFQAAEVIGGVPVGASGAAGTLYEGFRLVAGDDFIEAPTRWGGRNLTGRYTHSALSFGFRGTNPTWDNAMYVDPTFRGARSESPADLGIDRVAVASSVLTLTASAPEAEVLPLLPTTYTGGRGDAQNRPRLLSGSLKTAPSFMMSAQADWVAEARVRVPAGVARGYWPSFWTTTFFWPDRGEADIIEVVKNPDGSNRNTAVMHGNAFDGGPNQIVQVADTPWPANTWINAMARRIGNTVFFYDDAGSPGTYVLRGSNTQNVTRFTGAHDIRLDLAVATQWDGSTFNAGDWPRSVEFDWWRVWSPNAAAYGNQPTTVLSPVLTTPGGSWAATLPDAATLYPAGAGLEQVTAAWDNFDAPGMPTRSATTRLPTSMTVNLATRAISGTVPTTEGGAMGVYLTYAYNDGSPARRVLLPYYVAPAVQNLPSGWTYAPGAAVSETIGYTAFHSGNLGPHTYNVTAPGLTVSGNGTGNVTLTGTAAADVTVTIACTNIQGQTTTVVRTLAVTAAQPAYELWPGPIWYDASDAATLTLSGSSVTAVANKRAGSGNLAAAGSSAPTNITRAVAAQNGRDAIRYIRSATGLNVTASLVAGASAAASTMWRGADFPFTVVLAYMPTDANTGFIFFAGEATASSLDGTSLIRRTSTASSVRKVQAGTPLDANFGTGQTANVPRVVAIRHTGTTVTVWDNSTTPIISNAAHDSDVSPDDNTQFRLFASLSGFNATDIAGTTCNLDFYEIVAVNGLRDPADIQAAINALGAKWGIAIDGQIPTGQTAPTGMTFTPATVDENAPAGTTVGTFA